jgi:hypothetical protein
MQVQRSRAAARTLTLEEVDGRTLLTDLVPAPEQGIAGCDHRVRDGGRMQDAMDLLEEVAAFLR